MSLVYFIVLLGGLVFIHELGHFLAAKACNVKVLKFSLGFGPRIWGFSRGETEYQLAALPLGGYVKMLGEDPSQEIVPEDRGRGFAEQSPARRAFIAFAGPAFNLILPPLVFFGLFLVPQKQDVPVISVVVPDEAAERAGVLPKDRVIAVDNVPIRSFEEMREVIEARPGKTVPMVVERDGQQKTLTITPSVETDNDNPVETTQKGRIGVKPGRVPSFVGVRSEGRAYAAGLRSFDQIVGVNGTKVATTIELNDALARVGEQQALHLDVVRTSLVSLRTAAISAGDVLTVDVPAGAQPLGVESPEMYISQVDSTSNAWAAGLRPADRIVAVGGTPVRSAMRFGALIDGKKQLDLRVERGGQPIDVSFATVETTHKDKILGPVPQVYYGFQLKAFGPLPPEPSDLVTVTYSPLEAAQRGIERTVVISRQMVMGLGALLTGRVSSRVVGGPIQMYLMTSTYSEQGFGAFMLIFALISINLGIMNLIPIPVLDGFHIVLAAVEGISRRRVPMRVREAVTWVGVVMLLALMALAFTNDIVFRVL